MALFIWSLECCPETAGRLDSLLSADERVRRDSFHNPQNGARFASGRAELRRILAAELGREPNALQFRYNTHGKPTLDGAEGLHFSLSHSSDCAVLALSWIHAVGVDIEVPRQFDEDVAGVVLTDAERAALARLPATERQIGFYRYWTYKEAIVKAIGCGLSMPPNRLCIGSDGGGAARLAEIDPAFGPAHAWRLTPLDQVPGCIGAMATRPASSPDLPHAGDAVNACGRRP